jgi:hypothetical protein
MITKFKLFENTTYELSGKHSFLTFLQIISNHDFHFISNDHYTKLYNYHFFFSTETIKSIEEYLEIFKYKHSLATCYKILLEIKSNKLAFFFGVKENNLLRYGFVDLDSQRSYVVGEFMVTGTYFRSIAKYKALQFINKILQNTDVKHLSTLSKIKLDFQKFYTKSKKSKKIEIVDNKVINYFDRSQFSQEDLTMNRLYRVLDQWISKRSWRNLVEFSVDDTTDPVQFIIIVKKKV